MSVTDEWIKKLHTHRQTDTHVYLGILLSLTKEGNPAICKIGNLKKKIELVEAESGKVVARGWGLDK